jgi:hypothetical protein
MVKRYGAESPVRYRRYGRRAVDGRVILTIITRLRKYPYATLYIPIYCRNQNSSSLVIFWKSESQQGRSVVLYVNRITDVYG